MINASVDIGSNSTLLLAGKFDDHGRFVELENESRITSLGKGIDETGEFNSQSMDDTLNALKEFKEILGKHSILPENTIVTATEASRVAHNAVEFFTRIQNELGFDIQIINGEGEAYYSALGICAGLENSDNELMLLDIGGASSEIIKVSQHPFKIVSTHSFPIGSVRATEWLQNGQFEKRCHELFDKHCDLISTFETDTLICAAGTMTSFAAIHLGLEYYEDKAVNGILFPSSKIDIAIEDLRKFDVGQIKKKYPFLGKRASYIIGGCKVAQELVSWFKAKNIQITTFGLRYGTLLAGSINKEFLAVS